MSGTAKHFITSAFKKKIRSMFRKPNFKIKIKIKEITYVSTFEYGENVSGKFSVFFNRLSGMLVLGRNSFAKKEGFLVSYSYFLINIIPLIIPPLCHGFDERSQYLPDVMGAGGGGEDTAKALLLHKKNRLNHTVALRDPACSGSVRTKSRTLCFPLRIMQHNLRRMWPLPRILQYVD